MRLDQAIATAPSFARLDQIAKDPTLHLTFFAGRYFSVKGYEGEARIDDLDRRITSLYTANFEFDETERINGQQISEKTYKLYSEADALLTKSNWITQLFFNIWSILYKLSRGTICKWHNIFDYHFEFYYYTPSQFRKVFGCTVEEAPHRGLLIRKICPDNDKGPDRWEFGTSIPDRETQERH